MFAANNKRAFTCKDVAENLMDTYGIQLDVHRIRGILKEKLNYSFKRWSPRPLLIDNSSWKIKRILFSVMLLKLMRKSTILINIDESTITKSA